MKRRRTGRGVFSFDLGRHFRWLRPWLKRDAEPLTILLMSKGHAEVKKVHLSSSMIHYAKIGLACLALFVFVSVAFFVEYMTSLPERIMLASENLALKKELNQIQFHVDTLQTSVDRVRRFNDKLRALTEVDKEFAKQRGPLGQGGSEEDLEAQAERYDFGDFSVEEADLDMAQDSPVVIDRRQEFIIRRLFSQMSRLYKDTELESQSVEELFEVLKGRKLQLAATPSIMPVRGWVTSHFGYRIDPFTGGRAFHKGMDIAARSGSSIMSPAQGVVSFAGKYGSFGNTVKVFHGYGVSTLYAHLDDVIVRVGQKVDRGDVVGTVGSSGRSTGAHLHYEVQVHGVRVDPRRYILDKSL